MNSFSVNSSWISKIIAPNESLRLLLQVMLFYMCFTGLLVGEKNQGNIISLFSKTRVMLVCLNINRYTCFLPLVSTDDRPRQTTDSVLVQNFGTYSIYCAHSSELKYPTLFQITGWSDFTGLVLCQYLLDCHKFGTDWKLSKLSFTCTIHVQLRGFSWKVLPAYLKIGLFSKNGCIKFRPENDYF